MHVIMRRMASSLSSYMFYVFVNKATRNHGLRGSASPVLTAIRIFTLDGSNDADSRRVVPFGAFVDIASHFWGKIPQKPQFLGRE